MNPTWVAAIAALIGGGAAVWAATNASITLVQVRNNSREQTRPFVVAELRLHPFSKGIQELVIRNCGPTAARDLEISFDPPIPDPDPDVPTVTGALVRRFGRTINVLGPGTELVQIYQVGELVPGSNALMNSEPVPEQVVVSVTYYAGPDRDEYTDDFELDIHNLGLSTSVSSPDSPAVQGKSRTKSLDEIAKATKAIARAAKADDER